MYMNESKIQLRHFLPFVGILSTIGVLVFVLTPRSSPVEIHRQLAPPLLTTTRESTNHDTIPLAAKHFLRQRLWLPFTPSELHIFYRTPTQPASVRLSLYSEEDEQPKTLLVSSDNPGLTVHDSITEASFHFSLPPLTREQWIWATFTSNQSVRIIREIDSTAYPGGQLKDTGNRLISGVLAFSLYAQQAHWLDVRLGMVLLAGLLVLWSQFLLGSIKHMQKGANH
jgi:hypothetical protein